ncbi:MAG: N-acetyltransferase [Candidatus Margulisiibacteriota bacterium]|jgi:amino-acid N-acetyltransferase
MQIEKLKIKNVPEVQALISQYAQKGEMLPRPLNEIYENLRDYFVVIKDSRVIACGALHITWADLAEIKSLAVLENEQSKGYGRFIVDACIQEAKTLNLPRVFALTYKQAFFEKQGFRVINKEQLPRKIWGECVYCAKFMECDEICLIKEL